MKELNLPEFKSVLQKRNGKVTIFDPIRKKYVVLTPEEWVRQHFLNFLIEYLHYPRSLIKVESGLNYNQLSKRSDIVVFDRSAHPLMLIECKSYDVRISRDAFEQAAMYNHALCSSYIAITNGMEHWCCKITEEGLHFLEELPSYDDMIS